ncbi:hypothetical protein DPEC_G00343720, partial [Dallia pectoralis]
KLAENVSKIRPRTNLPRTVKSCLKKTSKGTKRRLENRLPSPQMIGNKCREEAKRQNYTKTTEWMGYQWRCRNKRFTWRIFLRAQTCAHTHTHAHGCPSHTHTYTHTSLVAKETCDTWRTFF